jgi:hypothetical protein
MSATHGVFPRRRRSQETLQKTVNCWRDSLAVPANAWLMCVIARRFLIPNHGDEEMTIDTLIDLLSECERIRTTESSLSDLRAVLSQFDDLWESMPLRDRSRLIELLIERIDYDGAGGKIKITFHPTGIAAHGKELAVPPETTA